MSAQVQASGDDILVGVPRIPWREVSAASIGNALEFYDLAIYLYFAVTIGKLFFPVTDQVTSLMLSVATFAISYIVRPFGAIALGSYADRAGRKKSLTLSISIIMLGTAMLVFAPTYAQIGIASPLIVVAARLLQGFSTGGEFGASTALMVEYAKVGRRGYYASWQASTQGLATVLAAGFAALLSYTLTPDQLNSWGWRLAFGVGLLLGPVGLYVRSRIDETPEFKQLAAVKVEKSPLRVVLVRDRVNLLIGIGLVAGVTAYNYVHKLYMPTYAVTQLHIPQTSAYLGAFVTGAIVTVLAPMFGALSDRCGRVRLLSVALPLICFTSYPLFLMLNTWPTVTTLIMAQTLFGVLFASCFGPLPALLAEIFPTGTRGTGLALSYNLAVTVFGSFAPLIATSLIAATANKLAPSFYVMATAILSVIAVLALRHRMARRAPA